MKYFCVLLVIFYVVNVFGQNPAPLKTVETFKTVLAPQIAKEESAKHGKEFRLGQILSAHYIGRSLQVEINFILSHLDKSMDPNLNCTATALCKCIFLIFKIN